MLVLVRVLARSPQTERGALGIPRDVPGGGSAVDRPPPVKRECPPFTPELVSGPLPPRGFPGPPGRALHSPRAIWHDDMVPTAGVEPVTGDSCVKRGPERVGGSLGVPFGGTPPEVPGPQHSPGRIQGPCPWVPLSPPEPIPGPASAVLHTPRARFRAYAACVTSLICSSLRRSGDTNAEAGVATNPTRQVPADSLALVSLLLAGGHFSVPRGTPPGYPQREPRVDERGGDHERRHGSTRCV